MSEIKVNKISPRSGTTVTLGDSGDTFTIPSGATINNQGTATNFGATGSASWTTTVKTGDFTAVAGEGYFVNTTSGEIDVALPAGTAGAVVAVKDYAETFDTNNCILVPNGSDKIGGVASNSILDVEGIAVTLVFVDSTQGWLVTDSGLQSEAPGPEFVAATGGTITTVCTNFKVHTFTGPGTFAVSSAGNAQGSNKVSYVVIAGGASGGSSNGGGGGGGAGGYREGKCSSDPYTASPLAATPCSGLPVSVQCYSVSVGGGGPSASPPGTGVGIKGNAGSNSVFSTITAAGGGGGGGDVCNGTNAGVAGGSGGGGGKGPCSGGAPFGAGNTPPVTPSQGFPGGQGGHPNTNYGGGGGGATAVGGNGNGPGTIGGPGGAGATSSINGTPTGRAGGGGGQAEGQPVPAQGQATCGGARGNQTNNPGIAATANTGGGGGGTDSSPATAPTGAGGSGIVIIRYKFQ